MRFWLRRHPRRCEWKRERLRLVLAMFGQVVIGDGRARATNGFLAAGSCVRERRQSGWKVTGNAGRVAGSGSPVSGGKLGFCFIEQVNFADEESICSTLGMTPSLICGSTRAATNSPDWRACSHTGFLHAAFDDLSPAALPLPMQQLRAIHDAISFKAAPCVIVWNDSS